MNGLFHVLIPPVNIIYSPFCLILGKVIGSGAFGEVYLAEVNSNVITDNSIGLTTRPRLSMKKDLRRGSTISVKGPIKVAVKTLKGNISSFKFIDFASLFHTAVSTKVVQKSVKSVRDNAER